METKIEKSSGNVFADLGLPNPEERLQKAELAHEIRRLIEARGLTQAQAGALLGVAQPNVSDLVRGKLARFSVESLMVYLRCLGRDVKIIIAPAADEDQPGTVTVSVRRERHGGLRPVRGEGGGAIEPIAASGRQARRRARVGTTRRGCHAWGI